MDINKMKVGLSYIFFENQKMDKMTKKQVLNYIEAADMDQLKLLAMDGDIHADLTKDARKIINVRFSENFEIADKIKNTALQGIKELIDLKESVINKSLDKAGAVAAGGVAAYAGYKGLTALKKRKCKKLANGDKAKFNNCMNK